MNKKEVVARILREMIVSAAEESSANISLPYKGSFGKNVSIGIEKILYEKYNIEANINITTSGMRMPISCSITIKQKEGKQMQLILILTEDEAKRIYKATWHRNIRINQNL